MPFIPHTPESLLRRSDSKNPATTCKGITTSGNHCRRSINSPPSPISQFPHRKSKTKRDGVLAILEPGDGFDDEGAAAFFCWQHKDQVATLTNTIQDGWKANVVDLKRRTSVETLAERLGLPDMEDHAKGRSRREAERQWEKERLSGKHTLPKQWQDVDGPLMAVHGRRGKQIGQPKRRREAGLFATLCCTASPDVDRMPPVRVQKYNEKAHAASRTTEKVPSYSEPSHRSARDATSIQQQTRAKGASALYSPIHYTAPTTPTPVHRPKPNRDPSSYTQNLLSFIPKALSPQTTSLLLAELAKPVSPNNEAGYIYIFWLTPNGTKPDADTVSSLLADDKIPSGRRESDVIRSHGLRAGKDDGKKTLLLKIGRASNVQRRMNEWTRQCGYDLSLIRFYPYLPSATNAPSPLPSPRQKTPPVAPACPKKVPHAHKVERLIHLELADKRVKRACDNCGKEHREWFEVQGSREGLKGVDGVVRRWVGWAEGG